MRGDLALQLRLALRPHGVVGAVAALAGAVAVGAVYLPWYEVHGEIGMLGVTRSSAIASLSGWEGQPWVWLAAALALPAIVVGVAVAIDRPPRRARSVLLLVALGIALVAGVAAMWPPPATRFLADDELQRLHDAREVVPDDVAVTFSVEPVDGIWVVLAAAGLMVAAAYAVREP